MLKRIFAITVLLAGISCFAMSRARIDVIGLNKKDVLKPGKVSKGFRISNPGWLKGNNKYFLIVSSYVNISKEWKEYSFSFTPDKDGTVNLKFSGVWHRPKGVKKNIAIWGAYDNITITGAKVKNGNFELVNKKGLLEDWDCNASNMATGDDDAKSGKNYIVTWLNAPVIQAIKVKEGQAVTVTFYAKASEGPVKKK